MENPEKTSEYPENPWHNPEINSFGTAKVDSLKDLVEEIEDLIVEREDLSQDFIKEGEKMKQGINNFLLQHTPTHEDESEFARERAELRKKVMDISELQLNERVGCWRDIALLKKELRDKEKELTEKTSRAEIIGKILEED